MTALPLALLTLAAAIAATVAIAEHLDARSARRHAAHVAGLLRAANDALAVHVDQRQTIADLVDALDAMQHSAESFKDLAEQLRRSLEIERRAADQAEERAANAVALYTAAIQTQLRAGFTIVLDHAGRRKTP